MTEEYKTLVLEKNLEDTVVDIRAEMALVEDEPNEAKGLKTRAKLVARL